MEVKGENNMTGLKAILVVGICALLLMGCAQPSAAPAATAQEGAIENQAPEPSAKDAMANPTGEMEKGGKEAATTDAMQKPGDAMEPGKTGTDSGEMMDSDLKFTGTVLAGTSSPLLDYNKADYEKAKASGKTILLYFYADWCPVCRAEFPKMQAAFNELSTEKVVGFRVNYNDAGTDADEVALAREFGVAYQHTKVALKAGERVLKSPESWEKERYLLEIGKLTQ